MSTPLARLLAMAYRLLIDDLHRELAARGWTDVREAFGFVLLALRGGPISLRELVATLGTSKQAVSKLVDAMVGVGLVERVADPHDARAKDLQLTGRGRALLADVEEIYGELEAGWARTLGPAGVGDLRRDLETVVRAAHGGALPPVRPTVLARRYAGAVQVPTVLVVDYGAQYAQLIARRVREAQVYSEIVPGDTSVEDIVARKPAAVILSGGPASVYAEGARRIDPGLFTAGVPVLGLCYGFQAMALALGGDVAHDGTREYGRTELTVDGGVLHDGLPARHPVWMSHGDSVVRAPDGFAVTAASERAAVAAFEDPDRRLAGVQYHPEVGHSPHGQQVLERFLHEIAGIPAELDHRVDHRRDGRGRARPDRRRPGDLRALRRRRLRGGRRPRPASHRRPPHLRVRRPRAPAGGRARAGGARLRGRHRRAPAHRRRRRPVPRRARGRQRARDQAQDHRPGVHPGVRGGDGRGRRGGALGRWQLRGAPLAGFLVQGTLYPDVVESGGGSGTATIKSHHNVGGLPDDIEFALVEPLRALFKDEVRKVGAQLGLPAAIVGRQPFPGPASASGSSARSPTTGSRRCAPPTPSPARSSPPRASTTRSGSAPWCCSPTSAASACRATAAPTATRSCCGRCRRRTR